MVVSNNFYFLKDASAAQESPITVNTQGELLTLQVEGTATSVQLQVLGLSDMASDEYYPLSGLTNAYDLVTTIKSKGLYFFGIDGVSKIKVNLLSVSGGKASVFGKITKGV